MSKTTRIATIALFGLLIGLGTTANAGDGKGCGGKKDKGDTAVVVTPARPLA